MACASIRSGKTHVTAQLIHELMQRGLLTRTYLIAPSAVSNCHYWFNYCGIDPKDAFTDIDRAEDSLREVVSRLKQGYHAFEMNRKHWSAYEKHRTGEALTLQERQLLEGYSWRAPHEHVPMPSECVILDDLQTTKVVQGKYFSSLVLRHRHLCGGFDSPRCGLTIMVLSQSLRGGAVSKALRPNMNVCLFWRTADKEMKREIYQLVSGHLTWKQFLRLFDHCTEGDDHPYMVFDQTQPRGKEFRRKLEGAPLDVTLFKEP